MSSIVFAIGASILKTFSTLSEKQVLTRAEPAAFTASASFAIAIVSVPLLYTVNSTHMSTLAIWMTALCAFFSTISAFTSAYVLKHLDISESASLFALSPAVITLMSVFLLDENLAWIQLAGIGLSCVGIFILEGHRHSAKQETHLTPLALDPAHIELPLKKQDSRLILYTALFFSLICFSSSAVLDRYVIHHLDTDPIFFLIIVQFFILFYFLIIDLFTKKKGSVDAFDVKILRRRSFWAHIFFVIAHRVFHMFAVQGMGASILHAIKQSSVVLTTVLGGKIFTEKHMVRRTIACLCVVFGVLLAII